jgi:hypothetical protein
MDDSVVPLLVGGVNGDPAEIVVDVQYVPPPPAWPWLVAIGVGLLAIGAAAWRGDPRRVTSIVGALLALVGVTATVTALTLSAVAPPAWWLGAVAMATVAIVATLVARTRGLIDRPIVEDAVLGTSGLALAGLVGLVDRLWLARSQLPTELNPTVARAVVAASIALGVGLALVTVLATLHRSRAVSPAPEPLEVAVS